MNYSGIFATTQPKNLEAMTRSINGLEWAEVYQSDENGRIVVVLEGETTEEEIARLQKLKRLPGILTAEMVYHYFEDEAETMRNETGIDLESIQTYLHDETAGNPKSGFFQAIKSLSNY